MMIKKLGLFLSVTLCTSVAVAAQLTPQQQAAKERGTMLYNQYKTATPELRIAAEAGDRESQYFLGEELRLKNQYMTAEAQRWYIAAAEQGDMYAMRRLASVKNDLCTVMSNCSDSGKTTLDWLNMMITTAEPLIEQGDGEAMYMMYLATGNFEWLEKSAEAGYPYGQYWLAILYRQGDRFFFPPWKRAERIEELMKSSSDGGDVNGMSEYMGILQKKGDLAAARALLEKAARTGHAGATGSYGAYLAHTPNTLDYPLDLVKGYGLISLLLELDGGGTSKDFAEDILPEIAAKMTPEQIEQAKAFAQEWEATHPPLSYFPEKLGF